MPARLNLPPEAFEARVKAQTRERVRRHRARNATGNATEPTTKEGRNVTPSHPLPVGETSNRGEETGVGAVLAPFAERGYQHDPRFWAKMAQAYPALDLELEALKLADWLTEPRNAKHRCSKARIDNWLRKAAQDRQVPQPSNGATNGTPYHQPITQQGRNPGPPDLPLFEAPVQRIDPAEMARFVAARRDTPLAEKLKARHGRHG